MKKRMLRSMLLTCMLVIMLMPTVALAEGEHSHLLCQTANCTLDHNGDEDGTGHSDADKVTFVEWTDTLAAAQNGNGKTAANSLPNEAGNYYLTADVTLSNTWTVSGGVTLCLNGHSITRGTGAQGSTTITVASGKSLTITDCSTKPRKGYIETDNWGNNTYWTELSEGAVPGGKTPLDLTGGIINSEKSGTSWGEYVVSIDGGAFTLYGGNLSGSKCDVVSVASGTFTMYGGNITGNKAKGVDVKSSGDFTMNGGTISYNGARGVSVGGEFTMNNGNITNNRIGSSSDGGGVHVSGGKFTMNGGTISGNWAAGEGGGVYFYNNEFTMNGGTITNNEAAGNGGGVYVGEGTFNMTGGNITGNKAKNGGGVYFSDGEFNMNGGDISNNEATSNGGGVYVNQETFAMVKGTISNNKATSDGGGVYDYLGTFTMNGGDITGNTAPNGSAVSSSTFNMSGGSITNNTVTGNDANDCAVCSYNTIKLSGNCTIFGNKTSNDVEKNLYVHNGKTITIAGELNNAKIGVTTFEKPTSGSSVAITTGSYSDDYSNCFFSDNPAYLVVVVVAGNNLQLEDPPDYDISMAADPENGTVQIPDTAGEGTTVTITATPVVGYEVDTVKYYKAVDGTNITEVAMSNNTGTFTMPAYNVTVSVTFKKIYSITSAAATNGTVTVDKTTAAAGDTVTITATPTNGYELNTIKVYKTVDENATITVTGNQFTMPADDVTVSVTFKEISSGNSSSSSPGSSSARPSSRPSGSSSGITSKTEKNEDGSSTKTTTNRITGTVTETTKNTDGTTGTTVTDKSGNITAVSATVPAAAASAAEKTGKPVTVPVEVPVAKRSEDALPIKVEIPTGGVTVEIPVENVTPGTVVVIVAKDGTEQVVRTSSVSETGVVVNLAQDATVKVVDMSHNFVDVHPVNHWAADAIDFVSARGIFNGTSADVFTPDGSMTRQALWMTLARMSGEEPVDMAAARDWAVENEVSDGSRPLETVTRQQYVTMLWRWAAAEGMDISAGEETNLLSFTDANKISDYAVEAFRWACGEGIVDGYNDDTLRAMTNASRAHAAAMMMRFCAGMVN